jgi:hypothetical protein
MSNITGKPKIFHVYPLGDLREHVKSSECWCKPNNDRDENIFEHNALDGREAFETGERKPS